MSEVVPITKNQALEQAEAHMLNLEQVDCPVVHHFGPGIYIREVTIPAGTMAIGHAQRYEHLNIMLAGKVAIITDNGVKELTAPAIFVGQPGKKAGYIIETCIWQNVYATEETDIEKLEEMYLIKDDVWQAHQDNIAADEKRDRQTDVDDFFELISDRGFTPETVREQSENEDDQMPMPDGFNSTVVVRTSNIEGKGLFASWPIAAGDMICPARIGGLRTPAGRYTNHAKEPNSEFVKIENGDILLVAKKDIPGCVGGSHGEEITVDYRQALSLSRGNLCQA